MNGQGTSGSGAGLRAGVAIGVLVVAAGLVYVLSEDVYSWFKAFHIIAVTAWMAGLFYLPRLFIYHHDKPVGSETSESFKIMEMRLYRIIMNPAMMLTWIFGLVVAWEAGFFREGWLHAKILAVVAMTVAHVYYGRAAKAFGRDERPGTGRHWRIMNEIPAVLLIVIVLLVVLKPF